MSRPLDGYRVADFGWVASAPILGGLLADAGAEVIKVESRTRWDTSRFTPDNVDRNPNKDPWFHCLNRGKLGITLNFSKPRALELALELVKKSDIMIENFSPGTIGRFGLDYESVVKVKPDIIMISMSGCGQDGPFSDLTAYGPSLNGLAGLDSLVGYEDERILGMQQPFSDCNAPIHGFFAVLSALYDREKTGRGEYIDLAQLEALVPLLGEAVMDYTMNQRVAGPLGNTHPAMAPHNNYPCSGDDKWISIAVHSDDEWNGLCNAMGNPDWCRDEAFSDPYRRIRNRKQLDDHLIQWTRLHTAESLTTLLQSHGVAAMPCMDIEDRYLDPHFTERNVFVNVTDAEGDVFALTNVPYQLSRTRLAVEKAAPLVGEHNHDVFNRILGLSPEEITRLEKEKVLY